MIEINLPESDQFIWKSLKKNSLIYNTDLFRMNYEVQKFNDTSWGPYNIDKEITNAGKFSFVEV